MQHLLTRKYDAYHKYSVHGITLQILWTIQTRNYGFEIRILCTPTNPSKVPSETRGSLRQ
jgi:hypothetical protein